MLSKSRINSWKSFLLMASPAVQNQCLLTLRKQRLTGYLFVLGFVIWQNGYRVHFCATWCMAELLTSDSHLPLTWQSQLRKEKKIPCYCYTTWKHFSNFLTWSILVLLPKYKNRSLFRKLITLITAANLCSAFEVYNTDLFPPPYSLYHKCKYVPVDSLTSI